jgi:hypothetical protein
MRPSLTLPAADPPTIAGRSWRKGRDAILARPGALPSALVIAATLAVVLLWAAGVALIALEIVRWWAEVSYSATLPGEGWLNAIVVVDGQTIVRDGWLVR